MSDENITGEQGIANQLDMTPEAAARTRLNVMRESSATYWEAFALGYLARDWEHLPEYGTFEAWRDAITAVGKPSIDQLAKVVEILSPTMTIRAIGAATQQSKTRVGAAASRVPKRDTPNPKAAAARERESRRESTPTADGRTAETPQNAGKRGDPESTPVSRSEAPTAGELARGEQRSPGEALSAEVTTDDEESALTGERADDGDQDDNAPRERKNWPKNTTIKSVTFHYGTSIKVTFEDGSIIGLGNGLFDAKYRDDPKFKAVVRLLASMWQIRWMELDRAVREEYTKQRE